VQNPGQAEGAEAGRQNPGAGSAAAVRQARQAVNPERGRQAKDNPAGVNRWQSRIQKAAGKRVKGKAGRTRRCVSSRRRQNLKL